MNSGSSRDDRVPVSNRPLMIAAGVCLAIPIIALMWVSLYAKATPRLWGFPFFFWYQFLWVFLCSGFTYTAHRLVIAARRGSARPGEKESDR